ncbi:10335_t:CDS:2, partial [Rhizophagus irregularis]
TKPSSATEIDEDVFDYDDIEDESDQQHVSTPVNTSGLLKDFMNAYINIGIFKILINRSQIHSDLNTTQDEDDEIKEFEPSSQDKNLVNIADELEDKLQANFEESEAESEL